MLQLHGYLATVDIRDPGVYTLQVLPGNLNSFMFGRCVPVSIRCSSVQVSLIGFFGDAFGEGASPHTLFVGGHHDGFKPCDFKRSMIDGVPIQITTAFAADRVTGGRGLGTQRRKCKDGTAAGRWVWVAVSECVAPYCTGHITDITGMDLVR